eukprot:1160071-Pelagomonas_calceolata.AAC.21
MAQGASTTTGVAVSRGFLDYTQGILSQPTCFYLAIFHVLITDSQKSICCSKGRGPLFEGLLSNWLQGPFKPRIDWLFKQLFKVQACCRLRTAQQLTISWSTVHALIQFHSQSSQEHSRASKGASPEQAPSKLCMTNTMLRSRSKRKGKIMQAVRTPPTSIKEKEAIVSKSCKSPSPGNS